MLPADIAALRVPGRPALAADGSIVVAVSAPDLDADLYRGTLWRLPADSGSQREPMQLTQGPRDSDPVIGPDGRTMVFLRAQESGPAQLHVMPLDGGEPRKLTDHPLGAGAPVFSDDGGIVVYCAAVPEPGRYGTGPVGKAEAGNDGAGKSEADKGGAVKPDAEPARRITRLAYRLDGEGFVVDKPKQLFVLDPAGSAPPVQLTDEPTGAVDPILTPDGRVLYVRSTGIDELTDEIAIIDLPGDLASAAPPGRGTRHITTSGSAALPAVIAGEIVFVGVDFTGIDAVGRTTGLWAAPLAGGRARRLTEEDSVDVDGAAGRPQAMGDAALVGVLDRGATSLRLVPPASGARPLDSLPTAIGGGRVVRSFVVRGDSVAAVVADGASAGEVCAMQIDGDVLGAVSVRSDFGRQLTATGLRPAVELTATAPDGYPAHGWLVLPPGDGPHPVLLVVHGGPHAAYTPALFDEAQVYASAGYAAVLGNPRGSAGYGQQHGRAVVGALGTVDVDDLLALLDAALERPDCDAGRVGVMGGSYGGFITSWLCSHAPGRFTAAVSERAVNAWDSFAGSSDIGYYFARAYVGADRDAQWRASPLAYADQIDVPLLIIHSEQDWRCPIEQAQRLFVALKLRGTEVELLLFPGEGHELSRSGRPRHRQQRFEAILDWWGRYLPVSPGSSVPADPRAG